MTACQDDLLLATPLLDWGHPTITRLIQERQWKGLAERDRILAVYNFVRDEVKFGYNIDDALPASKVLADGYGQCNTKGILLMALLRGVEIPCRLHGFTIDKALQKGAITGLWYQLAPKRIVHCWVEVPFGGEWRNLEGFILDRPYLQGIQRRFPVQGAFCGYGVATVNLAAPQVDWEGGDTYIQKEGIIEDFGVYTSPDEFFMDQQQRLSPLTTWLYRNLVRHTMNRNVRRLRG